MLQSIMSRVVRIRMFRKDPVGVYLRLNKWVWSRLPASVRALPAMRSYGKFLHTLVRLGANRRQFFGTFFFRNRAQLELIRRLSEQKSKGPELKIGVLGCSNGAEVYSILWTIRSRRPDLKVIMHAVDISGEILELGQKGVYSVEIHELVGEPIFSRMTEEEIREMFDRKEDQVNIKSWIKEGIIWHLGDAGDPKILDILGPQDMVVANNFLCHMNPPDAEKYLRNIGRLVKPGGYLIVSGIDLDVRTRVANDLGWEPLLNLIKEIHDGDPVLRVDWPWEYWGIEPFNDRRNDWKIRYASGFQLGKKS